MIILFPINIALTVVSIVTVFLEKCRILLVFHESCGIVQRVLWDCSTSLVEFVAKFAGRELGKPNSNSDTPRNYKNAEHWTKGSCQDFVWIRLSNVRKQRCLIRMPHIPCQHGEATPRLPSKKRLSLRVTYPVKIVCCHILPASLSLPIPISSIHNKSTILIIQNHPNLSLSHTVTNTLSKNPAYPDSNLEGPGWNLGLHNRRLVISSPSYSCVSFSPPRSFLNRASYTKR